MKLPRRQFLHLAAGAAALSAVSHIADGGRTAPGSRRDHPAVFGTPSRLRGKTPNAEGIFRTGSALFPGSLIRVSLPEQRENIVGANVRMWHESDVPALLAYVGYRGKTGQHILNASFSHF